MNGPMDFTVTKPRPSLAGVALEPAHVPTPECLETVDSRWLVVPQQ